MFLVGRMHKRETKNDRDITIKYRHGNERER